MKLKDFRELTKGLHGNMEIMGLNYSREYDVAKVSINTAIMETYQTHQGKTYYKYKRDGDGELEKGGIRVKVISVSS